MFFPNYLYQILLRNIKNVDMKPGSLNFYFSNFQIHLYFEQLISVRPMGLYFDSNLIYFKLKFRNSYQQIGQAEQLHF